MAKRSTMPANSMAWLSRGLEEEPGAKSEESANSAKGGNDTVSAKVRLPATVPADVAERVYRAAYWDRETVVDVITAALAREMDRREAERGEPYPPMEGKIRTGRPPGRK